LETYQPQVAVAVVVLMETVLLAVLVGAHHIPLTQLLGLAYLVKVTQVVLVKLEQVLAVVGVLAL
jgi:hypothetical protein